jgi:hypothetical protein
MKSQRFHQKFLGIREMAHRTNLKKKAVALRKDSRNISSAADTFSEAIYIKTGDWLKLYFK